MFFARLLRVLGDDQVEIEDILYSPRSLEPSDPSEEMLDLDDDDDDPRSPAPRQRFEKDLL
jgi:hypothetical protein